MGYYSCNSWRNLGFFHLESVERHGFGRKTFTFETDQNGNAKIYLMEGNQAEFHDMQLNDIWLYFLDDSEGFWKVINENMLKRLNSVSTGRKFVDFNHTFIYPTKRKINVKGKMRMYNIKGFTGDSGIISVEKNDIDWKITAYLLKHRFAVLGPDHLYYRNERNVFKRIFNGINSIMPWNNNGVKLSKCEAEWLNRSRFFNPNQPFFDKRPEIEMKVLNEDTDSPLFQFIAADEDGIHQLHLFVPDELKYQYRIDKLQGCKTINGKKKATVEFEIFNTEIKKGEIRMIDMHGNISSREFKYIEKTSEPDKEP